MGWKPLLIQAKPRATQNEHKWLHHATSKMWSSRIVLGWSVVCLGQDIEDVY